jgi:hypothetical protein
VHAIGEPHPIGEHGDAGFFWHTDNRVGYVVGWGDVVIKDKQSVAIALQKEFVYREIPSRANWKNSMDWGEAQLKSWIIGHAQDRGYQSRMTPAVALLASEYTT